MERLDEDGGECCQTKLANRTISHQGVPDAEVKWRGRRPCDDTLDRIFNHQGFRRVARRWGAVALVVMLVANSSMGVKALGEAGCGTFYQDQSCREDCGSCGQPCCALEFQLDISALDARALLERHVFNQTVHGGFDGNFMMESIDPPTAGTLSRCSRSSVFGPEISGEVPCVLFKGGRQPPGPRSRKQTDELSFGIYETGPASCTIKGWSRTKIVTSHCDGGRNYRCSQKLNLEDVILELDLRQFVQSTLYGCPQR